MVEFALPEDIELLRSSKKRDLGVSEKLQLCDDAISGVSSIELQWRWVAGRAQPASLVQLQHLGLGLGEWEASLA